MMNQYASANLIPSPFVKRDVIISHLMFANDLIVFSKATAGAAANLLPISSIILKSLQDTGLIGSKVLYFMQIEKRMTKLLYLHL